MTNTFLKPEKIIDQGLGLLQREIVLPRLTVRKGVADFKGTKNDTLTIRVPSILKARHYEWRTRQITIETDDLVEFSITTRLDTHIYSAVPVTDEELTLDIDNWGSQVARAQIRGVVEDGENIIASEMENARYLHTVSWTPGSGESDDFSFQRTMNAANKHLNTSNVPKQGRVLIVGANVEEAALNSPNLIRVNESGTDDALRNAVIGKIANFQVVSSNAVDEDFALAMHPTAFVFGNVAPVVPEGVTKGATATFEGMALRWIKDYDSDYARDRSMYSMFAGVDSVADGRDLDPDSETYGELTDYNVRAVEIAFTPGS